MLPEIFPIAGDALRKWLSTAGQDIILSSASGADALRYIRSVGMAIRTSDFYAIYNEVWRMQSNIAEIGAIPENQLVPAGLIDAPKNWDLSTDFLYRFQITGKDAITGDPTSSFFAIGSNSWLTPGQAASELEDRFLAGATDPEMVDIEYTLNKVFTRPEIKARMA